MFYDLQYLKQAYQPSLLLNTTLLLEAICVEGLLNWNIIDWMASKHLSSSNLHQFKNISKDHFWYLVMPTVWNTEAMAMKLFLDNILLLEVYCFEGFSNRHKMMEWWTTIQTSATSSDFKISANTTKDC